ncbi:hypothetical protein M3Y94_00581900 [Aphelenchoides besseyi]|nr:hypothetical protein M3Y94_00581900 [Aphelenchoides besseyi]
MKLEVIGEKLETKKDVNSKYAYGNLFPAQKQIVDTILRTTGNSKARLFFIHGGCCSGKTHLLISLYYAFQSRGYQVINTSFCTATAAELPNGKTFHQTFGISINNQERPQFLGSTDEFSLVTADVLLLDHVENIHHSTLELADLRMRRLTGDFNRPFGGHLIVVFTADFASLGPISSDRQMATNILSARFTHDESPLLSHFHTFCLNNNPQLMNSRFYYVLHSLGYGRLREFVIPQNLIVKSRFLAHAVFNDAIKRSDFDALSRRVILCAFNRQLRYWNDRAMHLLPLVAVFENRAVDTLSAIRLDIFEYEYSRFPPKVLRLRQHALLQLLYDSAGLSRGTILRYIGVEHSDDDREGPQLKCIVSSGVRCGDHVQIARSSNFNRQDHFWRLQFPVVLAFAQTVNKAGQRRFERIGIDVSRWFHEHGKSYAALSRVSTLTGIRVANGNAWNARLKNFVAHSLIYPINSNRVVPSTSYLPALSL